MSEGKHKSIPYGQWRRPLLKGLLTYLAIGLLCAVFADWLPMAESAKRVLTRIWGPALTYDYPTKGRDQITVMLVDDQDLHDYDEVWPVSMGFHQRRLLDLLQYHPKAVFFDIVFLDDRKDPGLNGFIDAACRARAAGTPVFIGAFSDAGMTPSRTQQAMLARHVEVAGQQRACIEPAYLNLKIDGFDQSVWEYDLNVPPDATNHDAYPAPHGTALAYPSPAARLYQVDHPLAAHVSEEPMAVVWGADTAPANLEWLDSDLHPGASAAPCTASWRWSRLLPVGKAGAPMCPYQQWLPVRTLKRTNGYDARDLAQAIAGKYVIIGTRLQSNGDVVLSPYHGRIAGAFLHAMALDNLLSFEGEPKAGGEFGHPMRSKATGFTLGALVLISLMSAFKGLFNLDELAEYGFRGAPKVMMHKTPAVRHHGWLAAREQMRLAWRWLGIRLAVGAIFFIAIVALIFVSYVWLDLGPLVWIEYALFPIAAEFLHLGKELQEFAHKAWNYATSVVHAIWPSIMNTSQ